MDEFSSIWNFDASKAPRSYFAPEDRIVKGEVRTAQALKSVYILAAFNETKVGRTRWLPDEGRWEGFTKGQQPDAWMPYPTYPARNIVARARGE